MFAQVFAPKAPVEDSVRDKIISDLLSRLQPARPWRAIIFGSYATGTANEDSDIDVFSGWQCQ